MNRREVRKKRLDLLMKRDQLENLLQHAKDQDTKEKLQEQINSIGEKLDYLVLPRNKVKHEDEFWKRKGWIFNKFDYIKFKLMQYTDVMIAEELKITEPTIRGKKVKWKLPKIKNEIWEKYNVEDFEKVMEFIEKAEEKGYDINVLMESYKQSDKLC